MSQPTSAPITLVVGAGERRVPGAVHHDVQPLEGIDLVCDFFELPFKLEPGACKEIHMTHVLEHFPMAKTSEVLGILFSLLAPGGKLYLEVPNFEWHAYQILLNPGDRKTVEYAFGGQHNQWDFHYNGFTPRILMQDLTQAGFKVTELRPNSSIECWSTKP